MDVVVVIIKERILMVKVEYSVLKEEIKEDECG
jgi:phage pi2 protein 07